MKPEYCPNDDQSKIGYLIEEAAEVLTATGKSLRWGLDSVNPELPEEKQETIRSWLKRELKDLKRAIRFVEKSLDDMDF